eukprot:1569951-Prymnesium_polylepis.1
MHSAPWRRSRTPPKLAVPGDPPQALGTHPKPCDMVTCRGSGGCTGSTRAGESTRKHLTRVADSVRYEVRVRLWGR